MQSNLKISKTIFFIVTPSYNQAQFLERTIQSVLDQQGDFDTYYFVADGGSSDNSKQILQKFAKQLSFVSQKDAGQTNAINKGIAHFKDLDLGSDQIIFAYINSDDYYLPDAFSTVSEYFQKYPETQWLAADAKIVDTMGSEIQLLIRLYKKLLRSCYFPALLHILNPLPQPAVFIRWDAIKQIGEFDESLKFTMDYDYWQRLQATFGRPSFLPQTLAAFRIHKTSKGGSQFVAQFAEELSVVKRYTTNRLLLYLHTLHTQIILLAYRLLK